MFSHRLIKYTSLDQVGPGMFLSDPGFMAETDWQTWYDGELAGLVASAINRPTSGLDKLDQHWLVRMNWFWVISDFYQRAATSERPTVFSEDETFDAVIQDTIEALWSEIRLMVEYWSIYGTAVMVIDENGASAVDPHYYIPIYTPWNSKRIIAHAFVHTYYEYDVGEQPRLGTDQVANRARIVRYDPGAGTTEAGVYMFSGDTVGDLIETVEVDPIQAVHLMEGESFYPRVQEAVVHMILQMAIMESVLVNNMDPPLLVPVSADAAVSRSALEIPGNAATGRPAQKLANFATSKVLTVMQESGNPFGYLEMRGLLAEGMEYLEKLVQYIHIITGAPPVVFGVDAGKGESGAAREKLMVVALSKVHNLRGQINAIIETVYEVMGFDVKTLTAKWLTDPFTTSQARQEAILAQVDTGIITPDEAREALGYPTLTPEQRQELENGSAGPIQAEAADAGGDPGGDERGAEARAGEGGDDG